VLLLALNDEKGTVGWQASTPLPYALAGALLAELALRGRIELDGKRVIARDATPTGDGLLDEALGRIATGEKPRDARHWVNVFSGNAWGGKIPHLRDRVAGRLVEPGILRREEHRFLWVISSTRFPTADDAPELALRRGLRAVLLGDATPDERTLVLLSLARAGRLLDSLVEKGERKKARARAKALVESEQVGKAVSAAVAAMEATVAAVAASAGAVAASSS
jgi:hypothetical protein